MAKDPIVTTSDQMQDLLLESPGFPEFLLGLATISASTLGTHGRFTCTITVERERAPATVASSNDQGRRLDEKQYALNDGPCLTAARGQRLVRVPDLHGDRRWGTYLDVALKEGVRSILAVPIRTEGSSRGCLNCYSGTPNAFNDATVELMQQHAVSMSRVLRLALRLHVTDVHPEHLRSALKSRAVVDAALSLIMLQHRSGRDGALEVLQLAARSNDRRIHEIANEIIWGANIPAPRGEEG
ncbi:MAG: GAF and ANTAR domain-containing protein [Arthrobacter sp.]